MKIFPASASFRQSGISLIECLVYIAVVAVVLGVATYAFGRCWQDSKHLRRNAEDIVHALHAGENWRADIRAATGPIQVTDDRGAETVVIPGPTERVVYSFVQGALRRQAGEAAPVTVLEHVKSSQMQSEPRPHVAAWRWELELASTQPKVRTQPLFTFEAVAGPNLVR